ncbi:MAG TPA: glycosyltransferase family 39 protein [Polyangia bacterium]|nr:glycosyltransferase family 39 protein [Polyangia bacterium]
MTKTRIRFHTALLIAASVAVSSYWVLTNSRFEPRSQPDAALNERIAANLAAGHGFSFDEREPYRPEVTRSPFLPTLAAAVYSIVGREVRAVLWINVLMIAAAVALAYRVARRLFRDERAALAGAWLACLAPQVSGAAPAFLTEAPAMLQVALGLHLLLSWPEGLGRRTAPLWAGGLGLVLASLLLNRPNFLLPVLIAAAWSCLAALRQGSGRRRGLLIALVFCAALGGPVLGWSARNASLGLAFSPMASGSGAGLVYEVGRYRESLLDPDEKLPASCQRYYSHSRRPLGPEELARLDADSRQWFNAFARERWPRLLWILPERLARLYGNELVSVYSQPWPNAMDAVMMPAVKWLSRALFLLAALGAWFLRARREALCVWLVLVGSLTVFHGLTVCNPRFVTPLLPVIMPYAGAAIVLAWDRLAGKPRPVNPAAG